MTVLIWAYPAASTNYGGPPLISPDYGAFMKVGHNQDEIKGEKLFYAFFFALDMNQAYDKCRHPKFRIHPKVSKSIIELSYPKARGFS